MSAPDTNTEKNKAAHKTPIVGMIGMVVFALLLLFGLVAWLSFAGNTPDEAGGVKDGVNIEVNAAAEPAAPAAD
jgi:hypothetical protein